MIWDSEYWKNDLLKHARELRRRMVQLRWTERSFARLEQTVMLGAYSIRKLVEARKLSESTLETSIKVRMFASKGDPVTLMNWHHVEHLYNVGKGTAATLGLMEFCNQIIHSYVFVPDFGKTERLEAILFASDRMREKGLYRVQISKIAEIFELVGSDYPSASMFWYNPKRRDYDVLNCLPKSRSAT